MYLSVSDCKACDVYNFAFSRNWDRLYLGRIFCITKAMRDRLRYLLPEGARQLLSCRLGPATLWLPTFFGASHFWCSCLFACWHESRQKSSSLVRAKRFSSGVFVDYLVNYLVTYLMKYPMITVCVFTSGEYVQIYAGSAANAPLATCAWYAKLPLGK
jgi:hypothetical protein